MIRDPSDGSVKGPAKPAATSGPPIGKANAEEIARLERSREWIKQYRTASTSSIRQGEHDGATAL